MYTHMCVYTRTHVWLRRDMVCLGVPTFSSRKVNGTKVRHGLLIINSDATLQGRQDPIVGIVWCLVVILVLAKRRVQQRI